MIHVMYFKALVKDNKIIEKNQQNRIPGQQWKQTALKKKRETSLEKIINLPLQKCLENAAIKIVNVFFRHYTFIFTVCLYVFICSCLQILLNSCGWQAVVIDLGLVRLQTDPQFMLFWTASKCNTSRMICTSMLPRMCSSGPGQVNGQ